MAKDAMVRKMYCPLCDSMEEHAITYKGTKQKKDGVHVKFLSNCLRCEFRHLNRIIPTYTINFNVIPIFDYNALAQKEIFAPSKR